MTFIADGRTDETYNQKYLNREDKEFLRGFDWCVEMAADNFFGNEMFGLVDEDGHLGHVLCEEVPESMQEEYEVETLEGETIKIRVRTYADLIRSKLRDWMEMERDELITSMIDDMDDDEYEANREKYEK